MLSSCMEVVITDTNIFIDLINIDLLSEFFNLGYNYKISDMVFNELKREQKREINRAAINFEVIEFDSKEVLELYSIKSQMTTLSIQDCSVYKLSLELGDFTLTADKSLRNKIEKSGNTIKYFILLNKRFCVNIIACNRHNQFLTHRMN